MADTSSSVEAALDRVDSLTAAAQAPAAPAPSTGPPTVARVAKSTGAKPESTTEPTGDAEPEAAAHGLWWKLCHPRHWSRSKVLCAVAALAVLCAAGFYFRSTIDEFFTTISTDDAYVNAHVTFVAPRVEGQVKRVLVDDNDHVSKGDVLVELDKEPYHVQLAISQAAVTTAEANLTAARAEVNGVLAQARAHRFKLEHAIEDCHNQVADLRAHVAMYESQLAVLDLAKADLERGMQLLPGGGISKEDVDRRRHAVKVAEAESKRALQEIYAIRASLGVPVKPANEKDLGTVPDDIAENCSIVRQALGELVEINAKFGWAPQHWRDSPREILNDFYRQDPKRDLDRIFANVMKNAPGIKQAEARLLEAQRDLARAQLQLRYCDVVSEIDGVVNRRNVNPGDHVRAGQRLMAVRSPTDIWIEANFKETQLANLRIGHRVKLKVDMYGEMHEYEGRISGFSIGTGSTLALLPAQNATGNFVKIVQRLPVRIELVDYQPEAHPLFVGLSVVPHVYYREPPTGPNAGAVLRLRGAERPPGDQQSAQKP